MKRMFFSILTLFCVLFVNAQSKNEITFNRNGFFKNGTLISQDSIKSLLTKDANCEAEYNLYLKNQKIGGAFAIGGGVLALGGTALLLIQTASGEMSWTPVYLAAGGLGVLLVGVPFMLKASGHLKKSIDVYNVKNQSTGYNDLRLDLNFGITSNGAGLICRF